MGDYSEKVLAEVCGPKGLCTQSEYFPSIAKLKKALDDEAGKQADATAYEKLVQKTLQEREEHYGAKDKGKYPTLESMHAAYPEYMQRMMRGEQPDKPKFDPVKAKAELLAKYNVSEEAFDAIPNSKDYHWDKPALNIPAKPLPANPEDANPFE